MVVKKGNTNSYAAATATSDSPVKSILNTFHESRSSGKKTGKTSESRESSSSLKRRQNEALERQDSIKKKKEESQPVPPQEKTAESGTHTPKKKNKKSKTPSTPTQPDNTQPTPTAMKEVPEGTFDLASPSSSSPNSKPGRKTSRGRKLSALSRRRQSKYLWFLEGDKCCEVWHAERFKDLTHSQRTALRPLEVLEEVEEKRVDNPRNFRGAPMVTTFIREAEGRATGVWTMVKAAELAFPDIRMADKEHPSLEHMNTFCSGRAPIYVHPSLYRALKVLYPRDVGSISRTNRVTVELGRGSMGQAVGVLTSTDFRPVVD